jgi:DNA-binding LacI/PurR family transcriptional regulator
MAPGEADRATKGASVTTARDIAERLNLSVSTVGRALADDRRISAETKFRVNQVAEELGYVVNRAARMMRGARSPVIGLVVPDIRNSFYSTVAHALTETMGARDHQVMLCETGDDRQIELRQIRDLAEAQVSGVVIVPTSKPLPDVVRLLEPIPHVQFLRNVSPLGPHWFGIDDRKVIQTATEHLLGLGHRRIAYIGGTTDLSTAAARLAGFEAAMSESGLTSEDQLTALGPPSSAEFGATALKQLLESSDRPTGVVSGSVQVTRGLLEYAHRTHLDVPGDVSLVGFGDEPGFSWWGPGLTTVALPMHDLATACGSWLLQRLDARSEPSADEAPYSSVSAGVLIERGSTAKPAAS